MPKRLAEIIIDAGLASRDEVVGAAQSADRDGVPLVVALVRKLGLDELALVAAVKRYMRISITDPAVVEHDPDAIRELSRDTCWRLRVMPISVSVYEAGPKTLHLAMADPTDAVAMAEIEHITGCQVDASLMPLSAVEEMVEKAYRAFVTEVIPRDRKPFGEFEPATQPMPQLEGAGDADSGAVPRDRPGAKPSTVPFHRVSDEASLDIRHRALIELLFKKGLITPSEYEDEVRAIMKQRNSEG